MSIKKKVEEDDSTINFCNKLENILFDLLDDDDPINIYMLTDICKQLNIDIQQYFPVIYKSGHYTLKELSRGNFETVLKVTQALYDTCLRFQKLDLALIVNSEVSKALSETGINLRWTDGKFYN